ncbi:HepT-like ribonuclease domain-containing protein [uncultured Phocaeicola sp.]|uniref:HepT-like ribonuclease domain-containing protein n=1 Tax=uncultured Phocaeicola sp. TaxID=990718 RepID=UPI0025E1B519|nr:HepT-like ribonuclease domain-containing protein [uncultured Phocaeicola sp.]
MCDDKTYRMLELVNMMLDSIHVIQSRTSQIKSANDFLLTPDNTFLLDGICMKLIFMGESVKTIDRLSAGKLFPLFPSIPWKEIMKLRDIIAHHYFKIDVDVIYSTIKEDLPPLQDALAQIKQLLISKPGCDL